MARSCLPARDTMSATYAIGLEPLTPPIHEACADDRGCQLQKRFVDVKAPFKADSQLAKASKPSVRPLHYPAMFAQPFAAFNAAPGNAAGYASLPQMGTAAFVVIAFVSMQLRWSLARSTLQACNARDRIQAPLEHHGVMSVRPADKNHQRDASGVYDDVPLGAEFSSVGGVRACFLAPRGLGTEEPSILARLQSIWSCSRKRISMAWCNLCQTPAALQFRSRRQQVMPLP